MNLLSVGQENYIVADKVVAITRIDASPIRRMISAAKDANQVVDCTMGAKTKAIIVMESGQLILSALTPEVLRNEASE